MMLLAKTAMLSAALLAVVTSCEDAQETANVQIAPDTGEYATAGMALRWAREGADVQYKVLYEAPSACHSAGLHRHEVAPGNAILIRADVAFEDTICAQMITVVSFEGTVEGISGPFGIAATVTSLRSGREVTLPAPAE